MYVGHGTKTVVVAVPLHLMFVGVGFPIEGLTTVFNVSTTFSTLSTLLTSQAILSSGQSGGMQGIAGMRGGDTRMVVVVQAEGTG